MQAEQTLAICVLFQPFLYLINQIFLVPVNLVLGRKEIAALLISLFFQRVDGLVQGNFSFQI